LIAGGADLEAKDHHGRTALYLAILNGATRSERWLRQRGSSETIGSLLAKKRVSEVERELTRSPHLRPSQECLQELLLFFTQRVRSSLMRKTTYFSHDPELLQKADRAYAQQEAVIGFLLDLGARPMLGKHYTPTQDAIQIASPRLLCLFIQHGADPELYRDLLRHAPQRVEAINVARKLLDAPARH
jgi:hypothetical protein